MPRENLKNTIYYKIKEKYVILPRGTCLTIGDLARYTKTLVNDIVFGKAIHIKNLNIFNEPRELSELDQVNNCCFEKEVDKDWEGLPIYACVFTNGCKYQSEGHTCDKHYFPLKHIHNMSKVFDNRDCKWKYVIALSSKEISNILKEKQTVIIRKNVLKEVIPND